MKQYIFLFAACILSCYTAMQSFQKEEKFSELSLANIEALANVELPEVVITCSQSPNDGIGKCYKNTSYPWTPNCVYTGMQYDYCSYTKWV